MKTISFFEYAKQKEVTKFPVAHIINSKTYLPTSLKGDFKCINA